VSAAAPHAVVLHHPSTPTANAFLTVRRPFLGPLRRPSPV